MWTMYMIYIAYCIVLQLVYMVHAANYIVQYSGPLCKVQHTLHIRKLKKPWGGWVDWVNRFGRTFPKKVRFLEGCSLMCKVCCTLQRGPEY